MDDFGDGSVNTLDEFSNVYSFSVYHIILWGVTCFYMATLLVLTIWPLWALMNGAASASQLVSIFGFKGLWVQCMQFQGGQFQCDNYIKPLFDLPNSLLFVRFNGALSMIIVCVGTGLILIGLECIRLLEDQPNLKRRVLKFGIFLILLSGVFMSTNCVYFMSMIKKEYRWYDNIPGMTINSDLIRYEYGGCLYAATILCFLCYILVAMWIHAIRLEDEFGPDDLLSESESTEVEENFQENSVITSHEENRIQQYLNQNTQSKEEIAEEKSHLIRRSKSKSTETRSTTSTRLDAVADEEVLQPDSLGFI